VRGLGGAGESSVWAQPEAAMPCMQGATRSAFGTCTPGETGQHGSCVQARRLRPEGVSVLSTWGLTARFDDFPTGLAEPEDVVVGRGRVGRVAFGRSRKPETAPKREEFKKPIDPHPGRYGIRAIRRLGGPAELPARCGGAITRSVPHHPRERRRRRPGQHRSQVDT
jgi:hypothetical protein